MMHFRVDGRVRLWVCFVVLFGAPFVAGSASAASEIGPPVASTAVQTKAQIVSTLLAGQQQAAAKGPLATPALPSPSGPQPAAPAVANNHDYIIYSGDSYNVINARYCTPNTVLITYPWDPGACGGGRNEIWDPVLLNNGYVGLAALLPGTQFACAYYNGTGNGTQVLVSSCDGYHYPANYQWRQPGNTPSCYSGWNYIVPAQNYGQTLNVAGGLGSGRNIILWSQSGCPTNDVWYFQPTSS